ncbi:AMP-dependent synthetase [Streptomyces yokosukanensis]|uniref:AMP-dependent synthetase n=1 Tax=Streptomyces yokosukanensis TaxID=67386 RepID=A0A101NW66_9ACTN|nr:AMP-binding protein [Streptomyces yokosukanensis]KUN00454.1 AMP-dependent synthetase [Streptomyces yokosukanensis]
MTRSVLNRIVSGPPEPGHHISFRGAGPTETYALEELYDLAGRLALQLRRRGLRRGDRIGILARNSLEWVLLDLAALRLGVMTAGFEAGKFTPDRSLLDNYGLKLLFSDEDGPDPRVLPMAQARRLAFDDISGDLPPVSYGPDDETTLKFTSGSTGTPKGLAATAGSIDSSLNAVQEMFAHGHDDELFVFLPLSLLQQRYWLYSALGFGHDLTISSYGSALPALRRTRPTVVMGVPAFYELAKRHIEAQTTDVAEEERAQALRQAARRLFGGRIRYLWTGSAPAGRAMLRFFTSCALPIYEGYGMNETCIVTKNRPGAAREGSVGQVVTGKTVLLDEHGNISVRSDFPVNRRYSYADPGASERVFAPDATVRTGDVGHLDADGFLYITGRADDVIALDNGRNVAVRPIEDRMRQSPAIDECVLFSPGGGELVAVVSPAPGSAHEAAVTAHLKAVNALGARHERISRAVVAPEPFSVDNGLLSSQYKPLRHKIRTAFAAELQDRAHGLTA